MNLNRRDFLKTTGVLSTGAALAAFPAADAEPSAENKVELARLAIGLAKKLGAQYADIRINQYVNEAIATREERVLNVSRSQSYGFGVRVLLKGAWGFAASPDVNAATVERMTREAVALAKANALFQQKPVKLVPVEGVVARWQSAYTQDPFSVPTDRKIEFLLNLNKTAQQSKGVSFVNSSVMFQREHKFYASTDGSEIDQQIVRAYPSLTATAVNRAAGDFQTRSTLPGPKCIGYEYLTEHPWEREAAQAGEDAVQKLTAKPVHPDKYDLVIDPTNLWLTIHETVGHSTELDRALLWEADFAGTSFLTPEKTGKLRFGSKICNFFADRNQPHGLATVGFDDEGVPGERWYLVKEGIFVDWQTTRDLAPLLGQKKSHGCLHADSWESVPFPRMPNVSLEPAKEDISLEQLIADVEEGILILGNGSWSIDQQRYNFQFGGQSFREIKKGKIGGMLRDVAYQSRTTDFWNACDAIGGSSTYQLGGAMNDGKGQPAQSNAVSHGCPVARFRKINVLNTAAKTA